ADGEQDSAESVKTHAAVGCVATGDPCQLPVGRPVGGRCHGRIGGAHSYFSRYFRTRRNATMLRQSVTRNSTSPRANAASVLGLSNSVSPISSVTICTVTVVTDSRGLTVRLAISPAA